MERPAVLGDDAHDVHGRSAWKLGLDVERYAQLRPNEAGEVRDHFIGDLARVTTHAGRVQGDTAVVKTGNPLQPFRVVLASKAAPGRTVSRVVTCNDDEPDDQ